MPEQRPSTFGTGFGIGCGIAVSLLIAGAGVLVVGTLGERGAQQATDEVNANRKLNLGKHCLERGEKADAWTHFYELLRDYPRTKAATEAREIFEKEQKKR